jgi:serine/threonine protein kinase
MQDDIIKFVRTKDFKLIDDKLGQGSTGKTVLLEDQIINERFVCKKYSPLYPEHQPLFFEYFKDEIKLLHLLYHKNVVRVFNYYLYPKLSTGYILMEFIKGESISDYIKKNPDRLNDIFKQTINGFAHLEENKILHRDIRPSNILISEKGIVKIIDFGFGKKIEYSSDFDKSISLNWRYQPPNDFDHKVYDFTTEIYFIGKLFEEIIQDNVLQDFAYSTILDQMTNVDYKHRIKSFFEIERKIISGTAAEIEFSEYEMSAYQQFAEYISDVFQTFYPDTEYITDVEVVVNNLEKAYSNCMLEESIQNNNSVGRCFVKGQYTYSKKAFLHVISFKDFLENLRSFPKDKQKVIINNLWQRLDNITRKNPVLEDDLPF